MERIRHELADIIFLGNYFDNTEATITEVPARSVVLAFAVHGQRRTNQRAIVVTNTSDQPRNYRWRFGHQDVRQAKLYSPFESVRAVTPGRALEIKPAGLHILVQA